MEILKPDQLNNLAATPNWADAGLANRHALVLDLRECQLAEVGASAVSGWLQQQPIPVIGIGTGTPSLADGLDLIASSEEEATAWLACIEAHPDAAAILVQTVRATASLPLRQALAVESLGYSTLLGGRDFRHWLEQKAAPSLTRLDEPLEVTRDGTELLIRLNNPGRRNALCVSMRDALSEMFQLVLADEQILTCVVSGNGPAFCAGGDLGEFGLATDPALAHRVRQLRMPGQYVGMAPDKFRFELHGACVGAGIEIPAFAGRVIATPDTWFQLPELQFGLIPGAGGCASIPRRIGRHRMNELALTGRKLSAREALDWNLIDVVSETHDKRK